MTTDAEDYLKYAWMPHLLRGLAVDVSLALRNAADAIDALRPKDREDWTPPAEEAKPTKDTADEYKPG